VPIVRFVVPENAKIMQRLHLRPPRMLEQNRRALHSHIRRRHNLCRSLVGEDDKRSGRAEAAVSVLAVSSPVLHGNVAELASFRRFLVWPSAFNFRHRDDGGIAASSAG
jgi:hypothetical protein